MAKQNIRKMFEHQLQAKELKKMKHQGYQVPEAMSELMSIESIEILQHFGPETPKLLNEYAISLEEALIEQVDAHRKYREQCVILADEVQRLRNLLPEEDRMPK